MNIIIIILLKLIYKKKVKMVQRWLYSTNAKDIAVLYFMLAIFSGMAGTAMSLIIRLELAAPGSQYLHGNSQLFNGAPLSAYISLMRLALVLWIINRYLKHMTNSVGANFTGTIACHKTPMISVGGVKCYMVRLTNFLQVFIRITISSYHLDIVKQVWLFYVEVIRLWFIVLDSTGSVKKMKDLNNTKGNTKSEGSTERGNSGVDRGIVVPNTQIKMRFLNQVRYYSVNNNLKIGKDTNIELSKDTSTSDLLEFEKLVIDNINEENINNNLLSIIKNVDILILAYNRIKSKPGNITPGTTLETLDGINIIYLNKLSNELGTGKFKFKPMRIVNIPKPKGGIRPLSVGNPRDKIVQEVIRIILDTIFDKKISTHSHGFRKNISCQTAIWEVRNIFGGSNWFIEVDLKKCFDTISHDLIIKELKRYISDKGFIDLVYKLLRAGYIDEKGTYHKPILGLPQGSLISPILCNIVITLVDNWLEDYINLYNKGKVKKQHPTYKKLSRIIAKAKIFSTRLKLHKERAKGPLFIYNDPNFKRIKYVRYADDILIGVLGSKNDCKIIKRDLNNFLNSLGLNINEEKTLITCATELPARFLGYNISITPLKRIPTVTKLIRGKLIRSRNTTRPIINAPIRDIINKLATNGYCKHNKNGRIGVPTRVGRWLYEEPRTIINNYKALGRGILNYYKLATNYKRLRERIYYVLYYSCVLTLASKYKLKTISKTIKKFGYNLNIIENDKLIVNFPRNTFDNIKKIENHGIFIYISEAKVTDPFEYIDSIKYILPTAKANFNKPCSICNSTIDVEIHHVKQLHRGILKALKDYILGRIITINRKQIPLCKQCHIKTHKNKFKNIGPGI